MFLYIYIETWLHVGLFPLESSLYDSVAWKKANNLSEKKNIFQPECKTNLDYGIDCVINQPSAWRQEVSVCYFCVHNPLPEWMS